MGNQQNLLILLAVIIVGVSIGVGMNYFEQRNINSARQSCLSELNYFSSIAKTWWNTPLEQGGGGKPRRLRGGGGHGHGRIRMIDQLGIYIGHDYNIRNDTFSTENGSYRIRQGGNYSVRFICTGNTNSNGEPIEIIYIYNMKTDEVDIDIIN
ncbi:MAG: hypothetical protein HOK80_01615 [Candidatus Cloacimonetes bacterium]|nr:hypothetical protein [Candidatus Cloacimonadota bacterium]MBT4333483.1 hypothetical protein [Candidatus Cloacimonadota bacterium]MBT5419559.1 hypothetical protein [Candidatus Cloacimonadota bacterium]